MTKGLFLYTVDRSDGMLMGPNLVFPVGDYVTFQDLFEFSDITIRLMSDEVVRKIIKSECIEEIEEGAAYKIIFCGYQNYQLEYILEINDKEYTFGYNMEFVEIVDD